MHSPFSFFEFSFENPLHYEVIILPIMEIIDIGENACVLGKSSYFRKVFTTKNYEITSVSDSIEGNILL